VIETQTRVDSRAVDEQVAENLRGELARRLSLDVRVVKPCVAMLPPQREGRRGEICHVLAVEYLRAGARQDVVVAELAAYAERCDQPPDATHAFTTRDALATLKSVVGRRKRERLRGYGCDSGPLRELCPYDGDKGRCPYLRARRRPRRREKLSTLLGTVNARRAHAVPPDWKGTQTWRRRALWDAIGALEVSKGCGGAALITSERELAFWGQIPQTTLRRDLLAMAHAGWIEYAPGLSRKGRRGEAPVGTRIYRLYPGDKLLAAARAAFPGSEEVE
jgi:hypothetical protein